MRLAIQKFMTPSPHTVGREQTLSTAHRIMRDHGVRHLPVLEAGKLVGILSQRDLHLIETLRDVDPDSTTVDEAMSMDVYVASSRAPLEEVVRTMAENRYGSAVIVDGGKVVGMFTTVDALLALAQLLAHGREASSGASAANG